MRSSWLGKAVDVAVALAAVVVVTALGWTVGTNPTTTAVLLFFVVLLVASRRGVAAGIVASILATAGLNYFFLPPRYTWNVEDPENWVALACLLAASIVAGRLLARVRREAREATTRRTEVEALYRLSVELFQTSGRREALGEVAEKAFRASGAPAGGVVLFAGSSHRREVVFWSGDRPEALDEIAGAVGRHLRAVERTCRVGRDVYLPLIVEGRACGVFVLCRTEVATRTLESIATLLAVAVERERRLEEEAQIESLRASDELKTALLRAVSHDLNTPLAAISLQAARLKRSVEPALQPVVEGLDREAQILRRRVEGLLAMARLEAGALVPVREPTPPEDLFRVARESLSSIARARPLVVEVAPGCPELDTDPSLALEIVINLVENADRASPPGEPLLLRAGAHPSDGSRVRLEILDRGSGLAVADGAGARAAEAPRSERGLGLEIARGLARALDARLVLDERPEGGTVARLDLPAALLSIAADE